MLTDEELTARLEAAFHETAPELAYGGRVPHVRRTGSLAATSVLAAAGALALAPAALQHDRDIRPPAVPSTRTADPEPTGQQVMRVLDLGGLRFAYAQVDGRPGPLYYVLGPDFGVPPDAERADIDAAGGADVWFAHDPAAGEAQVYVRPQGSSMVYGLYGVGWTRDELTHLLQHPVAAQQGGD